MYIYIGGYWHGLLPLPRAFKNSLEFLAILQRTSKKLYLEEAPEIYRTL
jgi:hypothetical protein